MSLCTTYEQYSCMPCENKRSAYPTCVGVQFARARAQYSFATLNDSNFRDAIPKFLSNLGSVEFVLSINDRYIDAAAAKSFAL